MTQDTRHLSDHPDWVYLLREFESLYRHGSAGGSPAIRSHRKKVRDGISATLAANPALAFRPPTQKPVTGHLPRALDLGEATALRDLTRALGRLAPLLTWEYGYDKMPKTLAKKFAYCDVLGPNGPIYSPRLVLGFVLFAPNTTYPQHSHHEIEESYISVAGAWSENNAAVYAPGSLILNGSGQEHRITTGDRDPCLLAYAWVGPPERLAAPGMTLAPKRRSAKGV